MNYCTIIYLLLIMHGVHYAHATDQFHFSLDDTVESIHTDCLPLDEDECCYDDICNRMILQAPPLWKRVLIKMYTLWYSYSYSAHHFVVNSYIKLKNYTYAWYIYLINDRNRIKK